MMTEAMTGKKDFIGKWKEEEGERVRRGKDNMGVPAKPSAVPHFAGAHPPRFAAVDCYAGAT